MTLSPHSWTPERSGSLLFADAIQRILPHRYPFLLLDRVTDFTPGRHIAGVKSFSAGDAAYQGYFPGSPLVPTAILLEMVTQLGGILVLEQPGMAGKIAYILQISRAELHVPVYAGDTLRVEAEVLKVRERLGELRGMAYRGASLVAEGQMRFAILDASGWLGKSGEITPGSRP